MNKGYNKKMSKKRTFSFIDFLIYQECKKKGSALKTFTLKLMLNLIRI